MGYLAICASMLLVLVLVCVIMPWDPRMAYRLLQHSQHHLFEPESDPVIAKQGASTPRRAPQPTAAKSQKKRAYISPYTKKLVAARQKWRCAVCGKLLEAGYEIDHINPLQHGGSNDAGNLQALCRSPCHIQKSASERSRN